MARFEFTVPMLTPPLDQRARLDTAPDDSGTSVTDVLIGGRVADPAQGFDLRGVGTFLGPDGVTMLYLKALDYRGDVVGYPVQLTGAAAGGAGSSLSLVYNVNCESHAASISKAFAGGVFESGDDYHPDLTPVTLSVTPSADGTAVTTSVTSLDAGLTELTAAQITAIGSVSGLSLDGSSMGIIRLDTPGSCQVLALEQLQSPPLDPHQSVVVLWNEVTVTTGTPGVTVNGQNVVLLDAGVYSITCNFRISVFWG